MLKLQPWSRVVVSFFWASLLILSVILVVVLSIELGLDNSADVLWVIGFFLSLVLGIVGVILFQAPEQKGAGPLLAMIAGGLLVIFPIAISLSRSDVLERYHWQRVRAADTIQAYQRYLAKRPGGQFAQAANDSVAALRSRPDLADGVLSSGSPEALKQFLTRYPGHVREADVREALFAKEPSVTLHLARTSFEVPKEWAKIREQDVKNLKSRIERQGKEQYKAVYGPKAEDPGTIKEIIVYAPAEKVDLLLIGQVLETPSQGPQALEESLKRTKEVLAYGIRSGQVRTVLSNDIVTINATPVHKMIYDSPDDRRTMGFSVLQPSEPNVFKAPPTQIASIMVLCSPSACESNGTRLSRIEQSIKIYR